MQPGYANVSQTLHFFEKVFSLYVSYPILGKKVQILFFGGGAGDRQSENFCPTYFFNLNNRVQIEKKKAMPF